MIKSLSLLIEFFLKALKRSYMWVLKSRFKSVGSRVVFDPMDRFSYSTITLGNDIFIGSGACFSATESSISISDKVMFGPNVTIMGGDHNIGEIGKFMYDIKTKHPDNDLPVVINNDVWVGAGAIILKGVSIGQGAVVAAGALVNKNVPEFAIVGGVPARVIGQRFSKEDLCRHKQLLGIK